MNRLKDHDVTWLYGPLQPSIQNKNRTSNSTASLQYYSATIKPILKKLSLSQQMLQSSLSSASLRRDSAGQAKIQPPRRNSISLNNSFTFPPKTGDLRSRALGSGSDRSSSVDQLPWANKNVRFHEVVGQCIALPTSGEEETSEHKNSESDEDVIMMRRPVKPVPMPKKLKKTPLPQTISKLPDASLKCPESEDAIEEDGLGLDIWQGPTILTPGPCRDEFDEEEEDNETDEDEELWKPPKWLQKRKDSVQIFHDKLKSIRMHCEVEDANRFQRPTLERRVATTKEELHVAKAPVLKDHDCAVEFDLPPCRSQLDSFSFSSNTRLRVDTPWEERIQFSPRSQDYFTAARRNKSDIEECDEECGDASLSLTLAKTAMVNRIMDEFWVVYNDMERGPYIDASLPEAVRKHLEIVVCDWHEPDEKEIVEDLLSIIYLCREQLTPHQSSQSSDQGQDHHHLPESPRLSSDSGYGSEETDKVRVVIRDLSTAMVEKEKGIQGWDLYPDAWDEDEAVAWERGY